MDLGVNSMETSNDIRNSRAYVNPGVSICNFVSLGFIVNKSSVLAVDNRLSMSATVTGGVGPELRWIEVAAVV